MDINFITHNHYYNNGGEVISQLNSINQKLITMAKTQAELAAEMNEVNTQLGKIGNESAKTLQKVEELQAVIDNQPNVDPALQTAFDALKAQVKIVDDMVPDSTEETPAPTDNL
jgi:seryl-tRNA synthetase